MLLSTLVYWPGTANSGDAVVDDLAADQMSVRELMHLDTALALSRAKNKLHAGNEPQVDTHGLIAGSGPLRLVAIYGVGKKLLAEVRLGSQPLLYMHGRELPVGVTSGTAIYRLRGITGSCVHLERRDESHTLCLHPGLWGQG